MDGAENTKITTGGPPGSPSSTDDGRWRPRWWIALTTVVSFAAGLAGLGHEVLSGQDRPGIIAACLFLVSGSATAAVLERRRAT